MKEQKLPFTRLNPMELKRKRLADKQKKLGDKKRPLASSIQSSTQNVDFESRRLDQHSLPTSIIDSAHYTNKTKTPLSTTKDKRKDACSWIEQLHNKKPTNLPDAIKSNINDKENQDNQSENNINKMLNLYSMSSSTLGGLVSNTSTTYSGLEGFTCPPSLLRNQVPSILNTKNELLIDWSLKTKATIITNFPCKSWARIRPHDIMDAVNAISITKLKKEYSHECIDQKWHKALHIWKHPASPLPSTFLSKKALYFNQQDVLNLTKEIDEDSHFLFLRQELWEESFRDLYYSFRRGSCPYFYVIGNQLVVSFHNLSYNTSMDASKDNIKEECQNIPNPFLTSTSLHDYLKTTCTSTNMNPLKKHLETSKNQDFIVLISRSTPSIRKQFEEMNIPFTTPFRNDIQQTDQDESFLIDELKALESTVSGKQARVEKSMGNKIYGPDSLILVSSMHGIHGVYNFLYNKIYPQEDVLQLYSPTIFRHGTFGSLSMSYLGELKQGIQEKDSQYKLKLSGTILPHVVHEICEILKQKGKKYEEEESNEKFQASFSISFDTHPLTSRLNALSFNDFDEPPIENRTLTASSSRFLNVSKMELNCMKQYIQSIQWKKDKGYTIQLECREKKQI